MNKCAIAAIAALAVNATAATTETYTISGPVNQALAVPPAKSGLARVDLSFSNKVNGTLTVNNAGAAQSCGVNLTLASSVGSFNNFGQFGAWKTWPTGTTAVSGFGVVDNRTAYYVDNLSAWQSPSTWLVTATAVAGGTLPAGISASGSVDASSSTTLTVTYTYAPFPTVKKGRK